MKKIVFLRSYRENDFFFNIPVLKAQWGGGGCCQYRKASTKDTIILTNKCDLFERIVLLKLITTGYSTNMRRIGLRNNS